VSSLNQIQPQDSPGSNGNGRIKPPQDITENLWSEEEFREKDCTGIKGIRSLKPGFPYA
jgi:hypothetical protein